MQCKYSPIYQLKQWFKYIPPFWLCSCKTFTRVTLLIRKPCWPRDACCEKVNSMGQAVRICYSVKKKKNSLANWCIWQCVGERGHHCFGNALIGVIQTKAEIRHFGTRPSFRHFVDDIFKCIFSNENVWISLKISLFRIDQIEIRCEIMN